MRQFYTIYNPLTLQILGHQFCTEDELLVDLPNDHGYLIGQADAKKYKVNSTKDGFEEYSEEEKNDALFKERLNGSLPYLDISLQDTDLNAQIEEYYLNRINATTWRKENYAYLRQLAYPDRNEKVDAEVKIDSGINSLVAEGNLQLKKYIEDCLNVKARFPKE